MLPVPYFFEKYYPKKIYYFKLDYVLKT